MAKNAKVQGGDQTGREWTSSLAPVWVLAMGLLCLAVMAGDMWAGFALPGSLVLAFKALYIVVLIGCIVRAALGVVRRLSAGRGGD